MKILTILNECRPKLKGFISCFWRALALFIAVFALMAFILGALNNGLGNLFGIPSFVTPGVDFATLYQSLSPNVQAVMATAKLISSIVILWVVSPLLAGIFMLGVRHLRGEAITATSIFSYYPNAWPLVKADFLKVFLYIVAVAILGFSGWGLSHMFGGTAQPISIQSFNWLVFAGIYLAVSIVTYFISAGFLWARLLIADKRLSAFKALQQSFQLFWHHKMQSLWLLSVLSSLACLPVMLILLTQHRMSLIFLVVYIWIIPWALLLFASVYLKWTAVVFDEH